MFICAVFIVAFICFMLVFIWNMIFWLTFVVLTAILKSSKLFSALAGYYLLNSCKYYAPKNGVIFSVFID